MVVKAFGAGKHPESVNAPRSECLRARAAYHQSDVRCALCVRSFAGHVVVFQREGMKVVYGRLRSAPARIDN